MISFDNKKRNIVLIPEDKRNDRYVGKLFGRHVEDTGVFNVFSDTMLSAGLLADELGEIYDDGEFTGNEYALSGHWQGEELLLFFNGKRLAVKEYSIVQNIFSRNTGILESHIMREKCAFILGCGSVGSLIALELARSGVGKFVLIDNDIIEYHNLCRHQCSVIDVGDYKVNAVAKRIKEINPTAIVHKIARVVEQTSRDIFDEYCLKDRSIIVGCADDRTADVYANLIAISYAAPFISIGCWERAFAGEIFYYLPNSNMPCYKCALGNDDSLSLRTSTNRRFYTTEEDLALVNFEPGISVDLNFVTTIGIKLILDILNAGNDNFTPRVLNHLQQFTLVCNTNNPNIGGEMAEIFSYPLQVTTSLHVNFCGSDPPCPCEFQKE